MPLKPDTRVFKTLIKCGRCGVCTACKLVADSPERYGPGGIREFVFVPSLSFGDPPPATAAPDGRYANGVTVSATPFPLPTLPCGYEGPVVESCLTCSGSAAEDRHVRACQHPSVDHDVCTRTRVGPHVQACKDCPDNPLAYRAKAILLTGGIGDAIAVDGMLNPEEKAALRTLYIASPAAAELWTLFSRVPAYRNLTHLPIIRVGKNAYYSLREVEAAGHSLRDVSDWSIRAAFNRFRKYYGSSLLGGTLCRVDPPTAEKYAVVFPHSEWGKWPNRGFDDADWGACVSALERYDLVGVVLGGGRHRVPASGRLIDMQASTTISESVELVKAASAYIGIDSWPSVLAAKVLPAGRMAVKTVSRHCRQWAGAYFAPHTKFPFLAQTVSTNHWGG